MTYLTGKAEHNSDLPKQVTLDGPIVTMRSIKPEDREPLKSIALDDRIWTYFTTRITDAASFDRFFDIMLDDQQQGKRMVFAVVDKTTDSLAGSMSYGNINMPERRLEIGWSWLGMAYHGKGINTWAKFELLRYGFEHLGLLRVEFKTDFRNIRARKALAKIGGTEEGIFRCYNTMPDGTRRDAVYFSVIASEWPTVKAKLTALTAPR